MNPIISEDMKEILESGIIDFERLRGKTVLITGAYGMLASYLVFMMIYFNEQSGEEDRIQIIALGRNRDKMKARFDRYIERDYFRFLQRDVTGKIEVDGPVDFIIHAASHASPKHYGTNPVGVMGPNLLGTIQTLELAREKKSQGYLFFSSGEVYGACQVPLVGEHDFGPYDPTNLRSCYGESKRAGETLCVSYAHQYGVPAKIVRPSHTYGPTMDLQGDDRVFASFVADAVCGRDIVMKSDGTATRNFIYLADAACAYMKVLLDGEIGEAYNVTNPEGRCSIGDLARLVTRLAPGDAKVRIEAEDAGYIGRGKNVYTMLDTAKISELGWHCRYSLEKGFERTIRSFLITDAEFS
jgi:nucleoside-diphosphate-sugar epimerase